jgi:hypothetical protein
VLSGQEPFSLHVGRDIGAREVRGYYIDFRSKAESPNWPPPWFPWPGFHRFMGVAQWGLGSYERYLAAGDDGWLAAATAAGEHLLELQEEGGSRPGAWLEPREQRHTFHLQSPWVSGMAQGQCASLLVRLFLATGDGRFSAAAKAALGPMRLDTRDGGARASLDGGPFTEEYPTTPPSFVLNGGIFGLWGYYDVWIGLGDDAARSDFDAGLKTVVDQLHRWDTGFWSRYDLYPHPLPNVASGFYHALHIEQLRALAAIAPSPRLAATLARFEGYAAARRNRSRAFLHKLAFRVAVSRR